MTDKYDFAGWVTKNDIICSDGVVIRHDAFKDNDGEQVPLVWNHNYSDPTNVLGHIILKHMDQGVYGFGFFNDSEDAKHAKELVKHGDISSMSIGARKIKRNGNNVIHGNIYEVSLVMAGANPGAHIESVMNHSANGENEEQATIFTGTLIHSYEDVLEHAEPNAEPNADKTIGDIIDDMTQEQQEAVYALIGMIVKPGDGESQTNKKTKTDGNDVPMKQNVFSTNEKQDNNETLKHSIQEVIMAARTNKVSSLKDMLAESDTITHGINSIEMLFPDAAASTNGNVPLIYKDPNTGYVEILNAVTKSPFSKVKTTIADLSEEEARAKGYITGNMKKEEYFSLIKRTTSPTTVYKKQKLDRDDVLDITDFDVVGFMNVEMQMMLKEEIARALLVGDGRTFDDETKINEQNIRPVLTDNEFFTIHKTFVDAAGFIEAAIKAMADYRGSGNPDMYIEPTLLADIKLLKGTDGRYLFGDIPSNEAIATRLGLRSIIPTTFMTGKGALIVNLRDYTLGATKGGQVTNFDDFDIDFNQYKYLIETRLSGALTAPKSAISLQVTTAITGATDANAGLVYGDRQADKTTTTTTTI